MLVFLKKIWNFLVADRILAYKDRNNPARSKNGILIIDKDGVARVDYSKPEAQRRLKDQIDFFASVDLSESRQ